MQRRTRAAIFGIGLFLLLAGWGLAEHAVTLTDASRQPVEKAVLALASTPEVAPIAAGATTHPFPNTTQSWPYARAQEFARETRCNAERKSIARGILNHLPPAATAEDALARGLLGSVFGNPRAMSAELSAAAIRWPDSIPAAWLAWRFCHEVDGCNRARFVRHLLVVDRDNAAAWLVAVDAARQNHDDGGVASSLRRAATAQIYDSQAGVAFVLSRPLLGKLGMPGSCKPAAHNLHAWLGRQPSAEDVADLSAHMLQLGAVGAGFSLGAVCSNATQPLPAARLRDCIAVLERMATDEDLRTQAFAIRTIIPLLDPQISAPWRERFRRLCWLRDFEGTVRGSPPDLYARIWSEGEVATYQAIARDLDSWPPPLDWLPAASWARDLVTEGR